MLRQLGVSVGFQFILMDIIKHLVCSLANNYNIISDLVTWCIHNIFLQNSQSTATSAATTMIQQQPSPHATVQQNQTRLGRLT